MPADRIPALLPRTPGHHFVLYGDTCSGVPGALHETTFASVNAVIRRLSPQPEFILFPGDEIIGLTPDADALRAQWRHWLDHEMAWLDRQTIPLWHTTGNHTTYDVFSEDVFREVLDLPRNGPPGQEGLSYWVRRGDLLLVFVHTLWTGLGGEGHVETAWLEHVLREHADARHKLVLGHHPVHPVNGFSGPYQREIGPEHASRFWGLLVEAGVLAYLCSHILAFDVQVHRGVLQICTAGAGTAHRMPEGVEYLHCVQAALDDQGLRYQVLDTEGRARERLTWPMNPLSPGTWMELSVGEAAAPFTGPLGEGCRIEFRFQGRTVAEAAGAAQTLFTAFSRGSLAPLWIGLRGPRQTLTLIFGREPGRSPHYWVGPDLPEGQDFDLHLAIHPDMGPGGVLYRLAEETRWSSFAAASATGLAALHWPGQWSIGHGQHGCGDRRFLGNALKVIFAVG
ncbi:metallophosphoesterase family protein [Microvirga subterranea]|uniref:Calcineurin-like phosphoesterase family protein n=1 Tax=Microvirga subterranea TaxID=186651 RepID=A0A370HH20_9HYPH|nr:hypothetical protein [Microvirga subterranea]RDI57198.1 calcineurin-like phosphoesterase family protein [Microvirga subterranea]